MRATPAVYGGVRLTSIMLLWFNLLRRVKRLLRLCSPNRSNTILRNVDHPMHEDARCVDLVGVEFAFGNYILLDLDNSAAARHGHDRVEVALRAAKDQVAKGVGLPRPYKGVIGGNRLFHDVGASGKGAVLL